MPITIGSNIASLKSQRTLSKTTERLGSVFERLSSGQRINRASDDAAGLAIADSLRTDARISSTAIRNANDAISMVNIISGSLGSQKSILTRMAELAEQSANGVYSYQQRKALDNEYQTLIQEFDRIAETSEFNGQQLLRSSNGELVNFMVGINGASTSLLAATKANSYSMSGTIGTRSNFVTDSSLVDFSDVSEAFFSAEVGPNGLLQTTLQMLEVVDSNGNKRDIFAQLSSVWNDSGFDVSSLPEITQLGLLIGEIDGEGELLAVLDGSLAGQQLTTANNYTYSTTLTFSDASTAEVTFNYSDITFNHLDGANTLYGPFESGGSGTYKEILSHDVNETAIGFTNVRWQHHARKALDTVNNRIDALSLLEGEYGALQSRLNTVINTLSVSAENFRAAESRIRDADIANESANLVKLNITQQAAAAVLSQANQQPALALTLLA